jgi:hypothetical protein
VVLDGYFHGRKVEMMNRIGNVYLTTISNDHESKLLHQHNGQKKKDKRIKNDLQNIHRRTDNTMADRKSTYNNLQNNTQKDRQYKDVHLKKSKSLSSI